MALLDKVRGNIIHPEFREMTPADVPAALDVIRRFSEDDYQVARHGLNRDVENQFVLVVEGSVVGVTGVRYIEGTDNAYWLSWTYLREDQRGKGLGQMLLGGVFEMLARMDARKVFLTTSDLRDAPDGPLLYGPAIKAYGRAGFKEEARHAQFYTDDEGQIVMGRRVNPDPAPPGNPPETRGCRVTDVEEIVETDDAYLLDWSFASPERAATTAEIRAELDRLVELEARVAFAGIPSDAPAVIALFKAAGFVDDGRLIDFYEDGVDEVRLRFDLPDESA